MNPEISPIFRAADLLYGRSPRVDLGVTMNAINIHAAIIATHTLTVVRSAHAMEITAAVYIENAIRALQYKLARSTYELVNAIINNHLTQRILPPVSRTFDSKIEKACTNFSSALGTTLITLTHGIFWLTALCSALILAYIPILGSCLTNLFAEDPEPYKKSTSLRTKNPAHLTVPAMLFQCAKNTAYAVLYIACMYLLSPIYVVCSAFALDSKFNIYGSNKSHSNGTVQDYILDIGEARKHTDPAHLPPVTIHNLGLFIEAHYGHPSMIVDAKLVNKSSNRGPLSLLVDSSISVSGYKISDWKQFCAMR